jgi:histone H3/H4
MAEMIPIAKFERFFRVAAALDVDKSDLRRYSDFVQAKTYDLLRRGEATAKANGRDIIQPHDLPITLGLQECLQQFKRIDRDVQLKPILEYSAARPPLELAYSSDTDEQLGTIVGGLSVALARSFKLIDPRLKNPQTEHWERAFRLFDLLL